jgi:hypothetical protein
LHKNAIEGKTCIYDDDDFTLTVGYGGFARELFALIWSYRKKLGIGLKLAIILVGGGGKK